MKIIEAIPPELSIHSRQEGGKKGADETLSDRLPYFGFSPETKIFEQRDGSLGAVFEAIPLCSGPLPVERVMAIVDSLKSWFEFPAGYSLQILYDRFRSPGHRKPSANFSSDGFSTRVWVSVRKPPSRGKGQASGRRSRQEKRKFSGMIERFNHESPIPLRQLMAAELIDVLNRFFNPKTFHLHGFTPLDPNLSLSAQVIHGRPSIDSAGIRHEGIQVRTLRLGAIPQFVYPGGLAFLLQLPFPVRFSVNFAYPKRGRIRRIQESLELLESDRGLQVGISAIVEGSADQEVEQRVIRCVQAIRSDFGVEAVLDEESELELYLSTLPLNFHPERQKNVYALQRILRSEATRLTPVFNAMPDLSNSASLCLTRKSKLLPVGPPESGNSVLVSPSSADQWALISSWVRGAQRMSPAPLLFAIQSASSHVGEAARSLDSSQIEWIGFGQSREIPVDPFHGIFDEERVAFLANFLMTGFELSSQATQPDRSHEAVIAAAIRSVVRKKNGFSGFATAGEKLRKSDSPRELKLTLMEVVKEIAVLPSGVFEDSSNAAVEALLYGLMPFYGNGIYAGVLQRFERRTVPAEKSAFVYDLRAASAHPVMRVLMALSVCDDVKRIMRMPQNAGRPGYLVLEEPRLLGGSTSAGSRFVSRFFGTATKLGLHLVAAGEDPACYFDQDPGRMIWKMADHRIFLRGDPRFTNLLRERCKEIDARKRRMIETLQSKEGNYMEAFLCDKKWGRGGVARFYLPESGREAETVRRLAHGFEGGIS